MPRFRLKWAAAWGLVVVVAALGAAQAVPYGRDHANPPVVAEPAWDSPQTRALAVRACFDCHSNESVWPWYSNIAPISWLVQNHVSEGRAKINFSEWDRPQGEVDEAAESLQDGSMPPLYYVLTHPSARLDPAEKDALARGLAATLGSGEGGKGEREEKDEDHDD